MLPPPLLGAGGDVLAEESEGWEWERGCPAFAEATSTSIVLLDF